MSCLCEALADAPNSYVVQAGDTLVSIVLGAGLCTKTAGDNTAAWKDCLRVAELVAKANGIPWGGPPAYSAPIQPGQVLSLIGVKQQLLTTGASTPSAVKWTLGAVAIGVFALVARALR